MRTLVSRLGSAALGMLLLGAAAMADEEKIPLDKLPKAVLATVKDKFPGADLVQASKEKENGQILYEVSLKHKGQKMDVTLKADGSIVEIEKEIAAKDLPEPVLKALDDKYPRATLKRAEEVIKGDKLASYEVLVVTAKKKTFEVEVAADGKILKEESKDKKKSEKKD